METTRQQKFSRLIQKELSNLFLRDGAAFYGKTFVTITQVKSTPDLGLSRIHLSLLGTKEPNQVIEKMNEMAKEIRGRLGAVIKNQVRHIPALEFFLDESMEYAENIERLLKEVKSSTGDKL